MFLRLRSLVTNCLFLRHWSFLKTCAGLLAVLASFTTLQAQDAETWSAKGDMACKLGQYQLGIESYSMAIKASPDTDRYYLLRAVAERFAGKFKEFFLDLDKTLQINPSNFDAYILRASAFEQGGDYADAVHDYTTAISINPKYADAFYFRGTDYNKMGSCDLAVSDFTIYLKMRPNMTQGKLGLAMALDQQGVYQSALDTYSSIIADKPDAYSVYVLRAASFDGLGRDDAAMSDLATAQAGDPRAVSAYLERAIILMRLGKDAEAFPQIQAYVTKANIAFSPAYIMPLFLQWILESERDHGTQLANRQLYSSCAQYINFVDDWRVVLARCLMDKASEEQVFKAVGAADPTEAEFYLGMKHAVKGDKAGAISLLTQVLKSKLPGQMEVRLAKARLPMLQAGSP